MGWGGVGGDTRGVRLVDLKSGFGCLSPSPESSTLLPPCFLAVRRPLEEEDKPANRLCDLDDGSGPENPRRGALQS